MAGPNLQRAHFDEQAALAELDRMHRELEESQKHRKAANEAFDRFLRSFGQPSIPQGPREPSRRVTLSGQTRLVRARERLPSEPGAMQRMTPAQGRRAGLGAYGILGIAVVVIAAAVLLRFQIREARRTAPASEPGYPPVVEQASVPVAAPTQSPVAGQHETELTTLRPVWVRVTVDGERVLERELRGDARIPFTPRQTIVIRAGDGGAVRLMIGGKDQGVLGRDGQVVTRTFTVQ